MTTYGMDVSNYQAGLSLIPETDFVIARVSKGDTYVDPSFLGFYEQAKTLGTLFAGYHFLRSDSAPEVQARLVYNTLPDKRIPVMLDVERHSDGISKPTWNDAVRFLTEAERIGLRVTMLYLPRWYWTEIGSPPLPDFPVLVSSWYGANDGTYPGDLASQWDGYGGQPVVVMQYTSRGSYTGHQGYVDLDAYRGTRAELATRELFTDLGSASDMGWYVDPGLAKLIAQVKARYPGMTVGTIGDTAHQAEVSDHNPEADGSVDAADFMLGTVFTKSAAQWLADTLIQHRDKRLAYVIYNGRICSSTVSPWVWRTYTGSDPHTNHVHVSVNDNYETDSTDWVLTDKAYPMVSLDGFNLAVVKYGMNDDDYAGYNMVWRLQKMLGVTADGDYGDQTAAALKKYMGSGDGKTCGLAEWTKLYGLSK